MLEASRPPTVTFTGNFGTGKGAVAGAPVVSAGSTNPWPVTNSEMKLRGAAGFWEELTLKS